MSTRGRPTLYHPDLCAAARDHCRSGASNNELAGLFGVSPRSIDNWIVRIPEFAAAVNEGRAVVLAERARHLFRRAIGYTSTVERVVRCRGGVTRTVSYTRHHLPETRACIRYLCVRRPQNWRPRPDLSPQAPQNSRARAANQFGTYQRSGFDDGDVADALYWRSVGCQQTVARVMMCGGEPKVFTYVRHHPPQFQAFTFWLSNRRPQNWLPAAAISRVANRTATPAAQQLDASARSVAKALHRVEARPAVPGANSGFDGADQGAAAGALNGSDPVNSDRTASSATVLPFKPRLDGLRAVAMRARDRHGTGEDEQAILKHSERAHGRQRLLGGPSGRVGP